MGGGHVVDGVEGVVNALGVDVVNSRHIGGAVATKYGTRGVVGGRGGGGGGEGRRGASSSPVPVCADHRTGFWRQTQRIIL